MNDGQQDDNVNEKQLIYPESLAPSKELLERSEKQQYIAYGYDRDADLYYFTPYEGKQSLSELGRKIFFVHRRHFCLDARELFQMTLEMTNGEDAYVFHEGTKQLYYSSNQCLEEVPIVNQSKLTRELQKICGRDQFYYTFLTFEQINQVITSNGGHNPDAFNSVSNGKDKMKRASLLLNDLFPPAVEPTSSLEEEINLEKLFFECT
ncbi:hypothetical protein Lqui_2433 [Legionella quinlivanii]|uniref:Uncharacterized protein n=1 Tax=Legionella quinlivanii TaxID=45073 RepID=A0A0W0XTD2_9GAMM|nr:hypothetical protein [Legionella quinlivanii]KTD47507.1 hypothetical protein Lqui_2433 [Legionella quinlivanii]SEG50668.1 hypothetical protein SAMN02746093_03184 [Legionella quinlivanii DSM 21216]STY49805.1 Uncharacterised protein [Legionella quinlivanii]